MQRLKFLGTAAAEKRRNSAWKPNIFPNEASDEVINSPFFPKSPNNICVTEGAGGKGREREREGQRETKIQQYV